MIESVKTDYPHMPIDFINLVLELHEKDPEYIEGLIKAEKQKLKAKRAPEPKVRLTVEELDELNEKFLESSAVLFAQPADDCSYNNKA